MSVLAALRRVDVAVYAAVIRTPPSSLDPAMRRLSRAADHSRLSIGAAGLLLLMGGARERRAAASGLLSVAATSGIVNLFVKPLTRRARPLRGRYATSGRRRVPMPSSASFPSGHTASAFAFASAVGRRTPLAGIPLRMLAVLVGYSRVHTGVHFPGDVVAGALLGEFVADVSADAVQRARRAGLITPEG